MHTLKRTSPFFPSSVIALLVLAVGLLFGLGVLSACTTTPGATPAQTAINAASTVCKDNDAAIVAADQAVLAGVLKGNDARNAVKGLAGIQAGCVATLASLQAAAAAAASAASAPR